jgi:hypothetical protein
MRRVKLLNNKSYIWFFWGCVRGGKGKWGEGRGNETMDKGDGVGGGGGGEGMGDSKRPGKRGGGEEGICKQKTLESSEAVQVRFSISIKKNSATSINKRIKSPVLTIKMLLIMY